MLPTWLHDHEAGWALWEGQGSPWLLQQPGGTCAHHPKYAEEPFLMKQYFHTERSDDYFCQNSEGKNSIKINKHSTGEGCKKHGCFTTSCPVTTATSLNLLPPFRFSFLSPSRLSFIVFEQHPAQAMISAGASWHPNQVNTHTYSHSALLLC